MSSQIIHRMNLTAISDEAASKLNLAQNFVALHESMMEFDTTPNKVGNTFDDSNPLTQRYLKLPATIKLREGNLAGEHVGTIDIYHWHHSMQSKVKSKLPVGHAMILLQWRDDDDNVIGNVALVGNAHTGTGLQLGMCALNDFDIVKTTFDLILNAIPSDIVLTKKETMTLLEGTSFAGHDDLVPSPYLVSAVVLCILFGEQNPPLTITVDGKDYSESMDTYVEYLAMATPTRNEMISGVKDPNHPSRKLSYLTSNVTHSAEEQEMTIETNEDQLKDSWAAIGPDPKDDTVSSAGLLLSEMSASQIKELEKWPAAFKFAKIGGRVVLPSSGMYSAPAQIEPPMEDWIEYWRNLALQYQQQAKSMTAGMSDPKPQVSRHLDEVVDRNYISRVLALLGDGLTDYLTEEPDVKTSVRLRLEGAMIALKVLDIADLEGDKDLDILAMLDSMVAAVVISDGIRNSNRGSASSRRLDDRDSRRSRR